MKQKLRLIHLVPGSFEIEATRREPFIGSVVATSWPISHPSKEKAHQVGERYVDALVVSALGSRDDFTVTTRPSGDDASRFLWSIHSKREPLSF